MSISRELAHDLKNPLTVINGYASLLVDSDLNTEHKQSVEKIKSATDILLKLIDDNTIAE